jgi:uncharacterized protein YoxC
MGTPSPATSTRRWLPAVCFLVLALALVGLGVYLWLQGLDRADKLASVIGVFLSVLGLSLSVGSLWKAARTPPQASSADARRGSIVAGNTFRDNGQIFIGDKQKNKIKIGKNFMRRR